jgi:UDP:flavonoid glycosyltransferase YjiC (YdhE family)
MHKSNADQPIPRQRPSILFVAEAVTLAHVARPITLAQSLDIKRFRITLACDNRYQALFPNLEMAFLPLQTIPSAQFNRALAEGKPVYDTATLRAYVRNDLALMDKLQPDLVVGDFRLSLAVSARLARIPYFAISNAYWSPCAKLTFPLPEHPLTRVIGVALAQRLFRLVRPGVFAYHSVPFNKIRREFGLPSLSYNLREIYTEADQTLYADIPYVVPTTSLPPHHHWLGPVLWSPQVQLPDWWTHLAKEQPIIYVTLGSSGENHRLPVILRALADLPVVVIAATAGGVLPKNLPNNVKVAPFLPGIEASARSCLVICNGGSPTTQQALAAGVPVIGVVNNMDQHLNMLCLEAAGVGLRLRAGQLTSDRLQEAVNRLLQDPCYTEQARCLQHRIKQHDTHRTFTELVAAQLAK